MKNKMKKKVGVSINKQQTLEQNIDNILKQLKDTITNNIDKDKAYKLLYWINAWGGQIILKTNLHLIIEN
jgi:hypothetical protein